MASIDSIPGFTYVPNYISEDEETTLLEHLTTQEWDTRLSRRTLHYGWRYPYSPFGKLEQTTAIPEWILPVQTRLESTFGTTFDQLIVNEYLPGQGIAPHVDHMGFFDDTIAVISIGSDTVLHMTHKSRPNVNVTVQRCSMYGMQDIARYVYKHSISRLTHDNMIPRKTRYSLTFRKTIRY